MMSWPRWTSACDRSRFDIVMISMNFHISHNLCFVLFGFFFLTRNYIYYTSVSCVWFLITVRELANITERENLHNSD